MDPKPTLFDIPVRVGLRRALIVLFAMIAMCGCKQLHVNGVQDRLRPSNDRQWRPEQARMPYVETDGTKTKYTLHNIRNCNYVTADDFVVGHHDRTIDISQIQSVDYIVVPFHETPILAHTMLSFGLNDGTYLAVSVEVRKEIGESFSAFGGFARRYEIVYVMGEERDLIRVRTQHRKFEVYVFPTVATPVQAQALFASITERMNHLVSEPEFYHTLTNNCTTNIKDHVNQLSPQRIQDSWQVLLPGFSAKFAYRNGLLDNRIPFEDLKSIAYVNDLAAEHFDDPDFSQKIRSKRQRISRFLNRESLRSATLDGPGDRLQQDSLSRPMWR